MRVAFLGNSVYSVPPLLALINTEGLEVAVVVTKTPRPGRRGAPPEAMPVVSPARAQGLPILEVDRIADHLPELRAASPDVLAVVAYGEILSEEVLHLAPAGAVNLHFSLLPRWRGAAPVQRAILEGDNVTGVTTMRMDAGLDTGPILLQQSMPIGDAVSSGTLSLQLSAIGASLLTDTLLRQSTIEARSQDDSLATLAPKIAREERLISWRRPAIEVHRLIRALSPRPGAHTFFRGRNVKVLMATLDDGSGDPGSIVGVEGGGIDVACGDGLIRLVGVVPEGHRSMTARNWANGARIKAGERFDDT